MIKLMKNMENTKMTNFPTISVVLPKLNVNA